MALFRTLRKVFRDFVKVENIVPISLDGTTVGTKATIQSLHLNGHTAPSVASTPFFRALASHGQYRTLASALRRDAIARLIGSKAQAIKTSSLLAFLGVSYKSGEQDHKPDLQDICNIFQSSFQNFLDKAETTDLTDTLSDNVEHYEVKERLGKPSSCAAVYSVVHESKEYAMKMMYNYGIHSNDLMIKKAFYKEYAMLKSNKCKDFELPIEIQENCPELPPHPNIIKMYQSFVDRTQCYNDSMDSYPDALPRRLNPSGFGRNDTLFLVMPKYDCNLKHYISMTSENEISDQTRLLVLLQSLEAITHLSKYEVAHRDLKADNILIKMNNGFNGVPNVALTDFGCCLCDSTWGMKIPYESYEVDKGGNPALMAPEILCKKPGCGFYLDYTKADVWSIGTLVYEIYNSNNPFTDGSLNSATYKDEDLPHLPSFAPEGIDELTFKMLHRDPSQRISASLSATWVALMLYAPNKWFECSPTQHDILSWLTESYLSVIHDVYLNGENSQHNVELKTRLTFLSRITIDEIKECLDLMQT